MWTCIDCGAKNETSLDTCWNYTEKKWSVPNAYMSGKANQKSIFICEHSNLPKDQCSHCSDNITHRTSFRDQIEIELMRSAIIRIQNATPPSTLEVTPKLSISVRNAFSRIMKYFEEESKRKRNLDYDLNRLHNVIKLIPDEVKLVNNDFKEYVAFSFDTAEIAILECPIVGNAMYVLERYSKNLLRLSKAVLANRHEDARFVHDREVLPELQSLIQTRRLRV